MSSSVSQASPMPSPSVSAWLALARSDSCRRCPGSRRRRVVAGVALAVAVPVRLAGVGDERSCRRRRRRRRCRRRGRRRRPCASPSVSVWLGLEIVGAVVAAAEVAVEVGVVRVVRRHRGHGVQVGARRRQPSLLMSPGWAPVTSVRVTPLAGGLRHSTLTSLKGPFARARELHPGGRACRSRRRLRVGWCRKPGLYRSRPCCP